MFNRIITALMEFAPPATETATPEMQFTPGAFVDNLQYMGLGMLGIFVVIGLIIGATALLNFIFRPRKK